MRRIIYIVVMGLFILMISSCGGETKNCSEDTKIPDLDTNISYHSCDNIWDSRDTICFKEYVDTSYNYFTFICFKIILRHKIMHNLRY